MYITEQTFQLELKKPSEKCIYFCMTTSLSPFLFPFYAQQMKTKADTLLQIKLRNQRGDGTPPTTNSINPRSVLPAQL